ncbi:MAG: CoxG family protein [Dehalococcoidia bacterium]
MRLDASVVLKVRRDVVWEVLDDINQAAQCLPGVEVVSSSEDGVANVTAERQLGPLKPRFSGQLTVLEKFPPQRLVFRAEGKDSKTGTIASATVTLELDEAADGQETRLSYQADINLKGVLGQFGRGIFHRTASSMMSEFLQCLDQKLSR